MLLCQRGGLSLDQRLPTVLPAVSDSDKSDITIAQLLSHTSGLPAYRPYFRLLATLPRPERRPRLHQLLVREPLLHSAEARRVLLQRPGFHVAGNEGVAENRLPPPAVVIAVLEQEVYGPLTTAAPLFFIDRSVRFRRGLRRHRRVPLARAPDGSRGPRRKRPCPGRRSPGTPDFSEAPPLSRNSWEETAGGLSRASAGPAV